MTEYGKSLLDYIAKTLDCFVSDLRDIEQRPVFENMGLSLIIQEIPAGIYPISEWNAVIRYLLEVEHTCGSQEEAKGYLLDALTS